MSVIAPSWFESVFSSISLRLENGSLPHAIAITSAPGWGLEHLCVSLAKGLLAVDKALDLDSVREFAHADFRWVEADGAEIKIDQIRQLNHFAVQTSQQDRKVAVIWGAERLNENAANALLKTLEEPPANTHLVLASENWGRVLPTIRSRCQRWSLPEEANKGRDWLAANGVTVDEVTFICSGAAPMPIYEYWEKSGEAGFNITNWLSKAVRGSNAERVSEIADLDPIYLLDLWYRRLKLHLSHDPIEQLGASPRAVHSFADQLVGVRRQIESKNSARVSANLMIEGLLVEWRNLSV